jgi:uncharacterized protein with gpF-like domain
VETDRIPQPVEAIRFLEKKINVPTEKWDDLKWGEHAHAFTVAHSVEANILDDIHGLLNKAIASGESYETWRKGMLEAMDKKGWYGGNGHTKDDTKYINWRLRVIYDTNMRTAYSAARYRKQLQDAEGRPVWVYKSKVFGDNRRQEHVALHDKAFRYDSPFWDTRYPPNGWGCQCYVTTKSEAGAEREGIKVDDSAQETLPDIDETWAYNPGREALAANFSKYGNLPKETLTQIYARYHRDMSDTRLTEGEFAAVIRRTNEADYKTHNISYQVGNLEEQRFAALRKAAGVFDAKIMATDYDLWHGTGDKNAKQKVPEDFFNDIYKTLQEPEFIYREKVPAKSRQQTILHLVKITRDGKKIKIIVHVKTIGNGQTAMRVRTFGHAEYGYSGKNYEEIKW